MAAAVATAVVLVVAARRPSSSAPSTYSAVQGRRLQPPHTGTHTFSSHPPPLLSIQSKSITTTTPTSTRVLTDTKEAGRLLRAGQLVAFPTETVYGLGASAYDEAAVRRIFEVLIYIHI